MSKPKIPTPVKPAAAPAPASTELAIRELGDEDREALELRKRRGRQSLRIDPQTGGVSSKGGAGINIPMK